jgi:6-phosphogluconolactonase (cycloisomerase 2 family)
MKRIARGRQMKTMTGTRWAQALAVLLGTAGMLLTGCKGFWNAPTSGGGGGGSASGVFYVLNEKTTQIAGFAFASGSTTPAAISGSPYALAAVPLSIAIAPGGGFLYVSTAAGIYLYTVGTGGALTLANGGQVISADPAFTMQVDPTGKWLVEAISGTGTVSAIPLLSTGLYNTALQEQSANLPSANVQQLAISGSTSSSTPPYVFVALGSGGTAVLPFTAANTNPFGSVSKIAPLSTSGGDNAVAVDINNPLLYVGETVAVSGTQSGGLRVFQISSSKISEITGSPYATAGTGPSAILSTTGYVYVANKAVSGSTTGNITGFAVTLTGSTYSLSSVSTVNAGTSPVGLAEDSTSTYVLAVNLGGNPDLNTYTFDTTTAGKLDAGDTAATGSDPVDPIAIAAVP